VSSSSLSEADSAAALDSGAFEPAREVAEVADFCRRADRDVIFDAGLEEELELELELVLEGAGLAGLSGCALAFEGAAAGFGSDALPTRARFAGPADVKCSKMQMMLQNKKI